MNSNINIFSVIVIITIILTQYSFSQWSYHGLGGKTVDVLEYNNGYLYAGTDDGLYRKPINSTDTTWIKLGLESKHITAAIIFDDTTYMVSVYVDSVTDTVSIYKTFDGGDNWIQYQHGFGGGESHWVRDFAVLSGTPDTIYAVGGTIAKSTDRGLTWNKIYGDHWVLADYNFVEINKNNPSIVWTGGGVFIGYPFLQKSSDYGESWQHVSFSEVWPGAFLSIVTDPHNPAIVYTGMQGQILKTPDGGDNWEIIFTSQKSYSFYDFSLSRDTLLYVSGALKTLHNHQFYISSDEGYTWETVTHPTLQTKGTTSLIVLQDNDMDILYFGRREGGVISYKNLVTSVDDSFYNDTPYTFSLEQNYPNPFNSETIIIFRVGNSTNVTIELFDVLGRKISTIFDGNVRAGEHITRLKADTIPSGVYYYRMKADNYVETKKLIINR